MLKVRGLSKIYESKKGMPVNALSSVSLDFGDKGLVFLLGKSGCGKTTLLNLLGGIDKATSGEVIVDNLSSSSFRPCDFDSYRNTYIGYVFQEYNLIGNYTVGINVGLALELQGKHADKETVDGILRRLELVDGRGETLYNRFVDELSGGQRQRVAIARALVKDPKIILADEPTGALDSQTGKELFGLLKNLSAERLIIVVTHDRETAEKYGDRIIELKDGSVISDTADAAGRAASAPVPRKERLREPHAESHDKFIRSKLPFKRAFKMGASALAHKKTRLALSVLLSCVTFIAFGFFLTAITVEANSPQLRSMTQSRYNMFIINSGNSGTVDIRGNATSPFSSAQMRTIREYNNGAAPMAIWGGGPSIREHVADQGALTDSDAYLAVAFGNTEWDWSGGNSSAVAELNPDTGLADANLTMVAGRLPRGFDEIAITDIRADIFMRFNYRCLAAESENGEEDGKEGGAAQPGERPPDWPSWEPWPPLVYDEVEINEPKDLIGLKLGELKIVGIVSTEISRAELEEKLLGVNRFFADRYTDDYCYGMQVSVITLNFVASGYQEHHAGGSVTVSRVLLNLNGSAAAAQKLLSDLDRQQRGVDPFPVYVSSAFTGFARSAETLSYEAVVTIVMVLVAVFSVFAALLMMNFITVSLDFKKKDIGILRALGARRRDITVICLSESLVIALMNFVLSLIGVIALCIALNAFFHISLFFMGALPISMLFLLCAGVSALATVLPVIRITGKKPVDIINSK